MEARAGTDREGRSGKVEARAGTDREGRSGKVEAGQERTGKEEPGKRSGYGGKI